MKHAWRAQTIATIVSVFAVAGCSSTQPDSIDSRAASVGFSATALVEIYDCYEEWQDTTGPNGVPDGTPDVKISDSLVCFPAVANGIPVKSFRPVPWRYTIAITVVRAGSTSEEVVTSVDGEIGADFTFISLTDYDLGEEPSPLREFNQPGTDLWYRFGRRVSTGNPVYLTNAGVEVFVPNILNVYPTFDFNLDSGDTVIVRARKATTAQAPPGNPPYLNLKISAVLAVAGVPVTPKSTPEGYPPTSTADESSGITFSYTLR